MCTSSDFQPLSTPPVSTEIENRNVAPSSSGPSESQNGDQGASLPVTSHTAKKKITKKNRKENTEEKPPAYVSRNESAAFIATLAMSKYILARKGQYVRDENGSLHIIIGPRRIELNYDTGNCDLARIFIDGCQNSTTSPIARSVIQRLLVLADDNSCRMRLRKFSAFSDDENQLYIPTKGGRLIKITAEGITAIENGQNADSLWVEHPDGDPFEYASSDPVQGAREFERLLVNTQACAVDDLRWLIAMGEGLFPFIRDVFPARFILVHIGPSQQGKTTGAERFILLHGLGHVKGDCTVAALADMGDIGLLVLDNKEQANFSQGLNDFCLFLATGAERSRSSSEGQVRKSNRRSVGVITTIEGVYKAELQKRCIEIEYKLKTGDLARADVEREIQQRRAELFFCIAQVLQQYLTIRGERRPTPNPVPNFKEHFTALCDLLRAFGKVAKKSPEWSEGIIRVWDTKIRRREEEEEEDELEHPILRVLQESDALSSDFTDIHKLAVEFEGRKGTLYCTECGPLLTALQKLNLRDHTLPRNTSGLGRRLRSRKYRAFQFLDCESAPDMAQLRRQGSKRPIGFFVPNDVMTDTDNPSEAPVMGQTLENEEEPTSSDSMTLEINK